MEIVLAIIIGIIIGLFVQKLLPRETIGVLRLDHSDPDSPYLFLEMNNDAMYKIEHRKYVTMEVKIKDYIPRG